MINKKSKQLIMKKIALFLIILFPTALSCQSQIESPVEKWDIFELTLKGPSTGNPFTEVELRATFTNGSEKENIKGFYDGDGVYKIRFMPSKEGIWNYKTQSNISALNGKKGKFNCTAPSVNNKGLVQVAEKYHFSYANGTAYYPVGTTLYCWKLENYDETLRSLKGTGYNKVRYMPFPHKNNKLPVKPFKGENHNWDFYRPNPEFWKMIEQSVADLRELGIQADFILFHPYDRNEFGLDKMTANERKFYLEYVVARLSAYQNVWWSMVNEYDLIDKTVEYWDTLGLIVAEADPYNHLLSVHGLPGSKYDWKKDWVTHVSYQISKNADELDNLSEFRTEYNKPVLLDEYGYEGDIDAYWGKLSGEEELFRHWMATIQGAYATQGESYSNSLYFWKGGTPVGKSFERVSWLGKEIFENKEKPLSAGLKNFSNNGANAGDSYFLYYYGKETVASKTYDLPKGSKFHVDIIDTWNMTVEEKGIYAESITIDIPTKKYIAIRIMMIE
jgi:hypothetical protein